MTDPTLLGLLHAYCGGDRLARRALLDWLEENGDDRYDTVEQEPIDWDKVTADLIGARRRRNRYDYFDHPEFARTRWYIDCAAVGSPVLKPEVEQAVFEARRAWLQELFPEYDLSSPR